MGAPVVRGLILGVSNTHTKSTGMKVIVRMAKSSHSVYGG